MVRSSRAVTVTTREEGSGYSDSALKKRWSRLRGRASISLLPVQKSAKRRAAAAISTKAKHSSRTAKHGAGKRTVQKDDEVNTQNGCVSQQHSVSGKLPSESPDSGCSSPEYHPDSDGEIPSPPMSPSTRQRLIDKKREKYMIEAKKALEYYNVKHPADQYEPVDLNVKHLRLLIDKAGYYVHMNFTAENLETKTRKIFFAELLLPYRGINYYTVTACDIIGPESPGGLRHVYDSNDILFLFDTMDMENCYACHDDVKHPEGNNAYEAGHMGHSAYED